MSVISNENKPGPDQPGDRQDDPECASELDRLDARLARLNRQAALLAVGIREKSKKVQSPFGCSAFGGVSVVQPAASRSRHRA